MSVDRKEIDLIIRAALQGGKTLDSVTKSIVDIEKALDAQAAAAKRGESSIDELKATLESLKQTQDQLKSQAGLIGQFQRLGEQIERTAERSAKAAKTYEGYRAKLEAAGKQTEFQAAKLIKLATASERSAATLAKQRQDQQELSAALTEAGISVDNLAAAEDRARKTAAQLGVTINRTQQAIKTYATDVRAARDAQRLLADDKAFEQKLQDASNLVKASEYVRFWTDALNKQDVAAEQAKVSAALAKVADEAIAAARGYKTLGTAAKSLSGSSTSLRDLIQGIVDPAAQARTSLTGIEEQVRKIGASVSNVKGPLENYRQTMQELVAVQKAVAQQAGMVDAFTRQVGALRQARGEYVAARSQVLEYANALRTSTGDNDRLQASLRAAQATLASARANLERQVAATRELRNSMRQAGLSTSDLAGTQGRLTSAAKASTQALTALTTAQKKYGETVEQSGRTQDLFTSSGRTTLSLMQRIRGEVLSMLAAYVGLYGAIGGAAKAIDAFNKKQGIQNQLALSVGNDNAKIAEEYEYIRGQADRVGISFEAAAKGYAKFSAAAKLAGRDSKEIRYIFEAFTEVGRVAGLATEDLDGVFKALEQIISKGTIQAEELRGQLGDRLFGAFQVAAQALKSTYPDLDKAMKDGKVTSDQLLKIAEKYREIVGERLPQATASLQANQARLNSALFDFKVLVAESGFADEFNKLLGSITKFLQSDDGTKFAKDLSDGLSIVVQGLRWVVENLQLVKEILLVSLGLAAARSMAGLAAGVLKLAGAFGVLGLSATGAATAIKGVGTMFGFVAAAAGGWAIGAILREKFVEVKLAGIALVIGFQELWTKLKYTTMIVWAEIPNAILDALSKVSNASTSLIREMLRAFSAAARGIGKNDLAEAIDRAIKSIEMRTDRVGDASSHLAEQMQRDLAQIRKIGDEMVDEALNPGANSRQRKPASATSKPSISAGSAKVDEKELERRKKLKEQIEAEMTAINARIERQEKDSLESRLKAIDDTYFKLIRKIKELGGKESEAFALELRSKIAELKAQETRKFNDALIKEQEGLQSKLMQIDAQIGRSAKTDLDKRLAAVKLSHQKTYDEIEELRQKLELNNRDTTPADLMKSRLDAGVVALENLERQKYYEDALNTILDERKAKLEVIAVNEKVGLITAMQSREQAAKVITDTQPKIDRLALAGIEFAEQMRSAAEAAGESTAVWDTMIAKMREAQNSAKEMQTGIVSAAQINEALATGATSAFESMAEAIGGAVTGMNSWSDAIRATRNAFLNFAADFIMEIGKMILKQALLNALQSASGGTTGGIGGILAGGINALVKHDGGVVGNSGPRRSASIEWFRNAPRYHGGGIAGLAPNEYPAILKKNEEVLTDRDPRNVLNGGKAAAAQSGVGVKIVNMIDTGSVISEGLSTQEGERAILNFIRANRTGLKQVLA
jgi:tape measure domain-containing protein